MNIGWGVSTHPLFWIMTAQWMLLTPLTWLAQDIAVPRHWRGLKAAILGLIVFAVVVFAILLGPLYLFGYLPIPRDAATRQAELAGFILGALLSLPLRSYLQKYMRRRAGFAD
jgi:hypothetical protein